LGASSAFFPHPVVLGLALDCPEAGDYSLLEPGFAVCLQMGYLQLPQQLARVQAHLVPGALEKYAVGSISLADNYLVTGDGAEWLSSALPQELLEIEIVVNS
jgi:Xaa-Pro aminopeptidase